MKNKYIIGLFLLLAFVQIVIPLSMIAKRESVLKSGQQFKFRTEPVDPYDAFRGRYVALQVKERDVPFLRNNKLRLGQTVYAIINTDEQGYAKLASVTTNRPMSKAYVQATVQYFQNNKAYLNLPIDRYYMEERLAPLAEEVYRKANQADKQETYVAVKIKDGFVVIEGLYVGGQRIEDAARHLISVKPKTLEHSGF
ncbi:MAG: GDYXXLXY domain-containing protein [Candidatus Omnitrophota bacterium]